MAVKAQPPGRRGGGGRRRVRESSSPPTVKELTDLLPLVQQADGFDEAAAALSNGGTATIDGAWGSACALAAAALSARSAQTVLVVLPRISDVDDFADDMSSFLGRAPLVFPAWESLPQEQAVADVVFGRRLRVLGELSPAASSSSSPAAQSPPPVIVASVQALMQAVPSREERRQAARTLSTGTQLDPEELMRWLLERGFDRVPAIEMPGEFSVHGGIVDVFPPDSEDPLRLEFFGDELESIRRFDVETQRKLEDLEETTIVVVRPFSGATAEGAPDGKAAPPPQFAAESLIESLPAGSWVVLTELADLVEEGRQYRARLGEPAGLFDVEATLSRLAAFPTATLAALPAGGDGAACRLQIESIERFASPRAEVLDELAEVATRDDRVLIACHNEGERERLSEMIAQAKAPLGEKIRLCVGALSRGFRMVVGKTIVLSDHELFRRADIRRAPARRRRLETRAIDSFLELNEGDLVVHLTNGIGRFRGMELLTEGEHAEEHMVLEFRDQVRMYVPASLIHLVQKYVGAATAAPHLSALGGTGWLKKKRQAANAVRDLASDMIRLQAGREAKPGIPFPEDSHFQHEFEASFPFRETADQLSAIRDVKDDMQRARPMDRLICGDVGYGKTEVAMRGAFKAIDAGKQVAVLVPTTVLAEQHFRTFSERMAEYPVNIEVLSRFRSKTEQRDIVRRLEEGRIDLVIGTHRLVQADVRLKDLGLLVIDEEQRFGVEAKDRLKQLRLEVDVLTLSATPIPRTLHLSLLGIRDISNLLTPPLDRHAIETRICRFEAELVRSAIVRELNRGGQVYFVHNRVYNIQWIADRIKSIVPEARIDIGHGQMREHELEEAMFRFVSGETDVLVCTTIIESGLDIPNANTIFIHQADKFGLADLHQLRGRVGRYKHRAYCYLLTDETGRMTRSGAKRLKAIEEFSELGAGFKIAMRDLEIRGAGNILGTEQSGHIAAIGYELYCQLLENAVRTLKNEPLREHWHVACDLPVSAFLPQTYVPSGRHRIEVYRKLSCAQSLEELSELEGELRDRFGPVPPEALRLLGLRNVQLAAQHWAIDDIHLEEGFAVFGYRNPQRIRELAKLRGSRLRIVDRRSAYLPLTGAPPANEELLELLKSVLQAG